MQIQIPYVKTQLTADIPDSYTIEYVMPKHHPPANDPDDVVKHAVYNPIGEVKPPQKGQTVAIAINDKTRPVPHQHLLPPILDGIWKAGIPDEDVVFVIATGAHPVMPPSEYLWILPEDIINRYRIVCHDAYNDDMLTYLGETSHGTPVYLNTDYIQADYHIVVGNIEPHQFQGFSGGVKSAAIGVAGKKTINHNHAMMTDPNAKLGAYDDNPARQDVEEIGQMIGIDFAVNAILNSKKQIIKVLAGDPVEIMKVAIPQVKDIYQVPVNAPYDLMIVSPGGYPKDINVYQSQKGLAHACLVMNDGGTVILCASCQEGTGSQAYESWVLDDQITNHDDVFTRFEHEGFQVGPHKAFQVSRDASRIKVMLVSDMDDDFVRKLLLHPLPDLQTALNKALKDLPENARIGIMPTANTTIPMLSE
jgi:lactate racemase